MRRSGSRAIVSIAALLLVGGVIIYSYIKPDRVNNQSTVPLHFDMKQGTAGLGSRVYIPLNLKGSLHENIGLVLQEADRWEKANPDKEILQEYYVWNPVGYAYPAHTDGIVIRFRIKE